MGSHTTKGQSVALASQVNARATDGREATSDLLGWFGLGLSPADGEPLCPRIVAFCAEPGMECGTVITRILAEAARSGVRVVRRSFSGVSPESATRSLTRLARELGTDSRQIAIGLDDLPPSDESCTLRQARALRKLWSAGALVLFSVYPEARQLVEQLPECTEVSAALLLEQCVSAPETDRRARDQARLTRGIPRLARALGTRGKERPVDSPSPAYLDALGEVVELSLRPTLSDEERRLRLAMLLLGRGTRGDLRLVLGEAPSDLLEGLRADAPLFGVSGGLGRFCALSSLSKGSFLTCLRHASSACALFPDVPAACLGLLVDHGDLVRASALATLPECAPTISKVVSHGAEFLDLGEVSLVLHSVKLVGDERPDAASRLEAAARALTSPRAPLAPGARGPACAAGEAESLFVDARRVLRGELPVARPDTPVRGRLRNRLMAHVRACVLMRRGAFSAALAMLVCGPGEGEGESVSGALLAIDRELARLMTGGSPKESSPAAEQAVGFMRRRPLKGLMGYVAMLDLVRTLMSDDEGSVAELEALSSRHERSEDTLVQIVALACGAVADLRGGSAARAKIRASLAGTLAHGAGVEYLERVSLCVAEVAAVRLGEGLGPATTEGRSDDLGSVRALVRGVLLSDDGSAIPPLPEGIPWDAVWLIRALGTGLGKFSLGLIEGMPNAWRRAASANGSLHPHAAAPKAPASQGGPGKTRKPIDLRLLGGFELRVRGVLIADWKLERRNAKAMLEYLVLHGGSARRFQLVDQVWPDSDYTSGFNRAYQAASILRKEIAEIDPNLSLLMSSRTSGEVVVDTNAIGCDVDAFRAAAREAVDSRDDARKLEFARAAERLYAGDLYVPTLDATGFISSMRDSLRGLYADAMVEGSVAALRLGHERTAARLAENAVRSNELREDANSALVRALRACGRGVEADRRLRSFEARLRRGRGELAAAPDETTE